MLAGVTFQHLLCRKNFTTWLGSKFSLGEKFCPLANITPLGSDTQKPIYHSAEIKHDTNIQLKIQAVNKRHG